MSSEPSVYIGLWRDYSEDGVNQLTITLPSRWGNYLISGMALLVSLAGSSLWTIIAYAFHQLQVHKEGKYDPILLQTQVLLRNSVSPASAIIDSISIATDRHKTFSRGVWRRISPILVLASLCIALFTLAGTFISGLVTHNESQVVVLAKPKACGGWFFNMTAINESLGAPGYADKLTIISKDTMDARLYAKWFYGDDTPLSIQNSRFPIKKLPYAATTEPCPFKGENRCLGRNVTTHNLGMAWDTGLLDSHHHLGVNAPKKDRVNIRKVMTCSPLNVDDLTNSSKVGDDMVQVNYRKLFGDYSDYLVSFNRRKEYFSTGYSAWCEFWWGIVKPDGWAAQPFDRDDVDLSICFVAQNAMVYQDAVIDPLFLATETFSVYNRTVGYVPNNYFNTIACIDQMQFCNPQNGKCTNVTHAAASFYQSKTLGLNLYQETAVNRTIMLLGLTLTADLGVGSIGAAGLLARDETYGDTYSASLPRNQWQKEAQLWFETGLALLQAHILRFLNRIDLTNPLTYGFYLIFTPLDEIAEPLRDVAEANCHNQKFTTTGRYQNFRFFRLMLVIVASLAIIVISLILEPCVKIGRGFYVTAGGQARQLARNTDNKFWLLRMVLDRIGVGPWKDARQTSEVNVPILHDAQQPDEMSLRERDEVSARMKLLRDQHRPSGYPE